MSNLDFNPDDLLKDIDKSILTKGIIIALVVHAIFVFGTSFGLYKDWGKYGIKAPSTIKAEKKQEQAEADKAHREAEIQRKAEAAAIAASNAVPVKATAEVKALSAASKEKATATDDKAAKKAPEVQPLPPASGEISLDELGL